MQQQLKIGDIVEAEITRITDFGAFARINEHSLGLIHISQISREFVEDIKRYLNVGDKVRARVIKLGPGKKIDLSLKSALSRPAKNNKSGSGFKSSDFEEQLEKFLQG